MYQISEKNIKNIKENVPNRSKDGKIEGGDVAECVPGGGTSMCGALQVGRGGGDEGCR